MKSQPAEPGSRLVVLELWVGMELKTSEHEGYFLGDKSVLKLDD